MRVALAKSLLTDPVQMAKDAESLVAAILPFCALLFAAPVSLLLSCQSISATPLAVFVARGK